MAISKRLSRKAFEQAAKRTTLQARGVEIAKCVMVDNEPQAVVANRYGLSAAAVSRHVGAVWSAHVQSETLPPGWEEVTAVLPADKVAIVRTWESEGRMLRLKDSINK